MVFFHVLDRSSLHNYADDNTLSYSHNNANTLKHHLQVDCVAILHWFKENKKFDNYVNIQLSHRILVQESGQTVSCTETYRSSPNNKGQTCNL